MLQGAAGVGLAPAFRGAFRVWIVSPLVVSFLPLGFCGRRWFGRRAVAVVAFLRFFSCAFGVVCSRGRGGLAFVFSFASASYSDPSSKLTTF